MATKVIECTGSPKPYFKTKDEFLTALSEYGFEHGKMTKKNNKVDILVTGDKASTSNKMTLAAELGVEVMTYLELAETFGLETLE